MRSLSITTKITIWYTVFLLVITGCLLGILLYTGNAQASQTAKTRLMDAVMDASEEIERFGGDFIIDKDLTFYEDGVYISVYDAKGGLVEGRRPAEIAELPDFQDSAMQRLRDDSSDIWYVYDRHFQIDGEYIWVRGIVKDFAEQGTFAFMIRLSAIAFPALVILAAIGGYVITRRGFRPVRRILDTVEEISRDGDLSRRVDLGRGAKGAGQDEEGGRTAGQDSEGRQTGKRKTPKDEIHKLASTFNSMFDKLERSFQQEKQFTSDVSHELRTPLAVIISQSGYAEEDESYREQALAIIHKEAKRMSGLVNRLLTLVRSDAGSLKLDREMLDLSGLCRTIAEQQRPAAQQKSIQIEEQIQEGVSIWADEDMIIRVFLNLVDNAIKYGREGGQIGIRLETGGGYARCSIQDDGPGIASENLERIWERFYRVDSSRSEEGAGLGLSMVKALVKAHGGKAEVSSQLGKGACFTVFLPLSRYGDDGMEDEVVKREDRE